MKAVLFLIFVASLLTARIVEYTLTVDELDIAPTGKKRTALAVNGSIPAPELRFTVGDTARITLKNSLKKGETSVHWHGLLVPFKEDGVPNLTTPPLAPGKSHLFEFELKHSGTYWYHSHTDLQEQQGVYGSIVVSPKEGELVATDRDYVVLLSEWINEKPSMVMKTLMRGSEYYALKKGSAVSMGGAIKNSAVRDYVAASKSRMPPMDISDIAFDQFWVNGAPQQELTALPGERVRLRFINGGAATYFYLTSSTGPFTIVTADGVDVQPVTINRILIGMAETYDVIVEMPKEAGRYEIRATSQDGSGHASIILGSGELHEAIDPPKPQIYSMKETMESGIATSSPNYDSLRERPHAPYQLLKSITPTSFDTMTHPVREIKLKLTGDMLRYQWSINDKTISEESVIAVKKGEILRLEFINNTMMHHPMHLHGHFFRVISPGNYENAPLKHTVDVPPMGKRVIEFEANEEGNWFLHCHLLYHMSAGMARVLSYTDFAEKSVPDMSKGHSNVGMFMLDGSIETGMSMLMAMVMVDKFDLYGSAEFMYDIFTSHHKDSKDIERPEIEVGLNSHLSPNLAVLFATRLSDPDYNTPMAISGVRYRFPFMFFGTAKVYSSVDLSVVIDKEFQISKRVAQCNELSYHTTTGWEYTGGLSVNVSKWLNLNGKYSTEHQFSAGIGFQL